MKVSTLFLLFLICLFKVNGQTDTVAPKAKTNATYYPALTFENPTGGGQLGVVIFGLSHQNRTRIAKNDDANAAIYVGLGDPEKYVGAGVNVNIFGLTNKYGEKDNLLQGGLDFHLNRYLLKKKLLLDVGAYNHVLWGFNGQGDGEYISSQKSFSFSGNYILNLKKDLAKEFFSYISITAGFGNGIFRKDKNFSRASSGSFNPFFSLATPLFKKVNFIAEWNGYDIATGLSFIVTQKFPLVFSFEVTDIIYDKIRIVSSISLPVNALNIFRKQSPGSEKRIYTRNIRPVRTI